MHAGFRSTDRELSSNRRSLDLKSIEFATLQRRHGIRPAHFRHIALMHRWETHGEILIGYRNDATMLAVNRGNGSSPEPLTTHQPVAKPILRCRRAPALLLRLKKQSLCRFGDGEAGEGTAVAESRGGRVCENGKRGEMESVRKGGIA